MRSHEITPGVRWQQDERFANDASVEDLYRQLCDTGSLRLARLREYLEAHPLNPRSLYVIPPEDDRARLRASIGPDAACARQRLAAACDPVSAGCSALVRRAARDGYRAVMNMREFRLVLAGPLTECDLDVDVVVADRAQEAYVRRARWGATRVHSLLADHALSGTPVRTLIVNEIRRLAAADNRRMSWYFEPRYSTDRQDDGLNAVNCLIGPKAYQADQVVAGVRWQRPAWRSNDRAVEDLYGVLRRDGRVEWEQLTEHVQLDHTFEAHVRAVREVGETLRRRAAQDGYRLKWGPVGPRRQAELVVAGPLLAEAIDRDAWIQHEANILEQQMANGGFAFTGGIAEPEGMTSLRAAQERCDAFEDVMDELRRLSDDARTHTRDALPRRYRLRSSIRTAFELAATPTSPRSVQEAENSVTANPRAEDTATAPARPAGALAT